jgi:hypothetical protein
MENSSRRLVDRLVGFDLLRVIILIPVVMMHVWSAFYNDRIIDIDLSASLYPAYFKYVGSTLGFAGIFILSMSFFLFGYLERKSFFKGLDGILRTVVLILAMLSTQLNPTLPPGDPDYFIWDMFSYVLLSLVVVSLLEKRSNKFWAVAGIFSALLLCMPPSFVEGAFSDRLLPFVSQMLFPTRNNLGPNGWFLVPWLGLPFLSFAWGRFSRKGLDFKHVSILFALTYLAIGVLKISAQSVPLGPDTYYYYYSFWQNPIVFWFYFLPFLYLLYIFSYQPVAQKLRASPFRWLSRLQWNKHFWFAFVLHFGVIENAVRASDFFATHPRYYDFLWLGVILSVELMLQMFFFMIGVYAKIYRKAISKMTYKKA